MAGLSAKQIKNRVDIVKHALDAGARRIGYLSKNTHKVIRDHWVKERKRFLDAYRAALGGNAIGGYKLTLHGKLTKMKAFMTTFKATAKKNSRKKKLGIRTPSFKNELNRQQLADDSIPKIKYLGDDNYELPFKFKAQPKDLGIINP